MLLITQQYRYTQWIYPILMLALAYGFTGWLGLTVAIEANKVTLFWLPTGIALAALCRWSTRVWPGIFLGAFSINLLTGASLNTNLIIACGNTLGPMATLFLLRKFNCRLDKLQRNTALSFFTLTCLGMLIPASTGSVTLMLEKGTDLHTTIFNVFFPWWMGDTLGILLVAPLLINITRANINKLIAQKWNCFWIFAVSFTVIAICFPLNNFANGYHLPILFLSFVCTAWAALRLGLIGSALCTLGFSFVAICSTANHLGPFALPDYHLNYWLLWLYTSSMTCLSLLITVAHAELLATSARLNSSYQKQKQQKKHLEAAQLMAKITHWRWDRDSDIYHFNPSMTDLFHFPGAALTGRLQDFIHTYIHRDDQALFNSLLAEIDRDNTSSTLEFRLRVAGNDFWLRGQGEISEKTSVIQGTFQDISDHKRLDVAIASAAAVSADSEDFFILILKSLMQATGGNHACISLLEHDHQDMVTIHTYLKNGEPQPRFCYSIANTPCATAIEQDVCFIPRGVLQLFSEDALLRQLNIESYLGAAIKNEQGKNIGVLLIMGETPLPHSAQVHSLMRIFADRIAGELRRTTDQDQIFNLAFFDPLTQLPNRRMLLDRLTLMKTQSERNGQYSALLFIDLDHFKLLNDTRGHHTGDLLLIQIAERIRSSLRKIDLAARLGGDEFVVVFDSLHSNPETAAIEAKKYVEDLHESLSLPYLLHHSTFHCTVSMGVKIFNNRQMSIDDLLRHADVAMYQAKDNGRNTIRFFDPHMQALLDTRAIIESDLRSAQKSGLELVPYYQVQVNDQGKAVGAELLLRWQHATKGIIYPAEFIPIAEQTGIIVSMGKQVIRQACEQLQLWQTHPLFSQLSIAVNVSPIQFNQKTFISDVIQIASDSKINQQLLKLELTESSLLSNIDQNIDKMLTLQNFGIGLSMDDFGIGYSSLSYLKRLPIYQLKIDQSFVRDIAIDPNDATIVRTIIAMAKNLNLNVIAEGVETEEQKSFLEQNGCALFQGYYFSRALPIAEFEQHILQYH